MDVKVISFSDPSYIEVMFWVFSIGYSAVIGCGLGIMTLALLQNKTKSKDQKEE